MHGDCVAWDYFRWGVGAFRADRGVCFVGFAVVSVDIYACPFCNITWYLCARKSKINRMQKRHE